MKNAEIILLPERKENKQYDDIDNHDIVLLFLSVLKMAKEYLTDTEFNALKKHIE